MKYEDLEKYKSIITSYDYTVTNITEPTVAGSQHNLLIADTAAGKRIFKFNTRQVIQKNVAAAHLYNMRKIPVPNAIMGNVNNTYFETYRALNGITLDQAIKAGIGAQQIQQIYEHIITLIAKMDHIYPELLPQNPMNHIHNIGAHYVANNVSRIAAPIAKCALRSANRGPSRDSAVYHSGMTPKNTIVSSDGKFVGFVDLDEICVCNRNYAFAMMAAKYQQLGMDYTDLIKQYERVSNFTIDYPTVSGLVRKLNTIRHIMWKLQKRTK